MAEKYATYIGEGRYMPGIPARDMTEREWNTIDEEDRATLVKMKLYKVAQKEQPKSKAKEVKHDD